MVTFAEYFAQQLRDDPTALRCMGCWRRKPRELFRETPWHGRAAACKDCEGYRFADNWSREQAWRLEQEREKTRALRRGLERVRARRAADLDIYRAEIRRLQDYVEEREYFHGWPTTREIPVDVAREVERRTEHLKASLDMAQHGRVAAQKRDAQRMAVLHGRLTAVESIASALEDALPGDNWHAAHAIRRVAAGDITPDEALTEAWPDE